MFEGHTSIERIVAHCPLATEPLAARLRISHLLQSVDFSPRGLAPNAILFVRRTSSPRNFSLVSFRLSSAWEGEMRERIESLYRRAARPVRGIVPSGAEAVLFADMGEWLACLGIDVQAQTLDRKWYWRDTLRGETGSPTQTLARVWSQSPRFVPAAVVTLARWGQAVSVLRTLSDDQVATILVRVASEFNVPTPRAVVASSAAHDYSATAMNAESIPDSDSTISTAEPAHGLRRQGTAQFARWTRWFSQVDSAWKSLSPPQTKLLALSVTLFHQPWLARSPEFLNQLSEWSRSTSGPKPADSEPVSKSRERLAESESSAHKTVHTLHPVSSPGTDDQIAPPNITVARDPVRNKSRNTPESRSDARPGFEPSATLSLEDPREAKTMAGVVHERSVKADGVDEPVTRDQLIEGDEGEVPAILKEVPQPMWWVDSDGVRTDIGGVVFLLNLFIRMNLFECFEEDFKLSQHISGWGLVELFGRTWLSIFGQVYEADNLWEVLERLDGREPGAAVAAGFENRDSYRIPPAWLLRFAPTEEPWQLLDCPGRLVLWHEGGGFPIVDCPLNGVARDEILTRQIAFYRNHGIAAQLQDGLFRPPDEATNPWPAALNRDVYFQRVSPPLMTWLSRTFPFLRYVLRYAFGAKSGDDKSLIENLFLKPGTIYCTATHFDLVMGLGEISLDVRRTCLDANPGWVPELMRVILFHFL